MPRPKRSPIQYTPQFGAGIFRSKEEIAGELATLEKNDSLAPGSVRTNERTNERVRVTRSKQQTERQPQIDLNRPTVRTNERTKVRHSFDIYTDQLHALAEIQTTVFKRTGRKPKMGELVQDALDTYIERSNVRTNG